MIIQLMALSKKKLYFRNYTKIRAISAMQNNEKNNSNNVKRIFNNYDEYFITPINDKSIIEGSMIKDHLDNSKIIPPPVKKIVNLFNQNNKNYDNNANKSPQIKKQIFLPNRIKENLNGNNNISHLQHNNHRKIRIQNISRNENNINNSELNAIYPKISLPYDNKLIVPNERLINRGLK